MSEIESTRKAMSLAALDGRKEYHEKVKFANGYGVNIIRRPGSYGYASGLFEVAVLGLDGRLTFNTPVADDVIGWQTIEDVLGVMAQVEAL